MRKTFVIPLALGLTGVLPWRHAVAQGDYPPAVQVTSLYQQYSADQLDNLLAPVALYPDPLLAQVLVAATFPDQVEQAARWVRANGAYRIDEQYWDVSVKSVAHYPTVLTMMSERPDWTTSLGQAYAGQSTDVMVSVQRLRSLANARGNLVTTPQQQVIYEPGYIQIVPAQPQVIYVPTYDPYAIYSRRVFFTGGFGYGGGYGSFWSFGFGFPIGSWLCYDLDWRERHVYYDDWRENEWRRDGRREGWRDGGWRARARPYVRLNDVYVNRHNEIVNVNRQVVNRPVNVDGMSGYNSVHRDVTFANRAHGQNGGQNEGTRPYNPITARTAIPREGQATDHRARENPARSGPPHVLQAPAQQYPRPTGHQDQIERRVPSPVIQAPVSQVPRPMIQQDRMPRPMVSHDQVQRRAAPPQMQTTRPVPQTMARPTIYTPAPRPNVRNERTIDRRNALPRGPEVHARMQSPPPQPMTRPRAPERPQQSGERRRPD